ncbi:MAG: type II secretion system GspH family protein, partial [Muribaculaceae bacterium]|nr:type II secretion system GspH family protein [Muribaculaceae bacterium]
EGEGRVRVRHAFTLAEGATHVTKPPIFAKAAFTLAEVLITLGIIGVVAAMTIPTMMSKWREKALIAKLKESYSILNQAYKLSIEEHGDVSSWNLGTGMYDKNAHMNFANYIKPSLKLSYDCVGSRASVIKKCLPKNTKHYEDIASYAVVRLINGAALAFRIWDSTCSSNYNVDGSIFKSNVCGYIVVFLEPDKIIQNGLNAFSFYATTDSIIPWGLKGSRLEFEKACDSNIELPYPGFSDDNMYGCTAWVLQNNNMDYWRCPGKLGWDKARSCEK